LFVACYAQIGARVFVGLSHLVVGRNCCGRVLCSAGQQFGAEAAAFVDLKEVNGNMLGLEANQFFDRIAPALLGLVRQAGDQVETDIADPGSPQDWHCAVDIGAAVDPAWQLLQAPAFSVPKVLRRAGMKVGDIDLFEIHEAFSAQVLSNLQAWGSKKFADEYLGGAEPIGEPPEEKINPNGGSIVFALTPGDYSAQCLSLKSSGANYAYLGNTAGSNISVLKACKAAGVDPTTSQPFEAAMQEMNRTMDEMEKILAGQEQAKKK